MLRWFLFFSRWPLWALHLLGSFGGWAAWLLSGPYRSRFLANVRQAGLDGPAVLGAVGQAGRMTAELPRLWLGRTPHLEWADDRAAAQAYAEGQGVLFLTPHMGCFEVTAQALALRFGAQYGQLTVLYRPARHAALGEVMALAQDIASKDPDALTACKEGYRFSLEMSADAAINYAAAKSDQLTMRQKDSWRNEGIGDFLQGKYRPGLGGHENAEK